MVASLYSHNSPPAAGRTDVFVMTGSWGDLDIQWAAGKPHTHQGAEGSRTWDASSNHPVLSVISWHLPLWLGWARGDEVGISCVAVVLWKTSPSAFALLVWFYCCGVPLKFICSILTSCSGTVSPGIRETMLGRVSCVELAWPWCLVVWSDSSLCAAVKAFVKNVIFRSVDFE